MIQDRSDLNQGELNMLIKRLYSVSAVKPTYRDKGSLSIKVFLCSLVVVGLLQTFPMAYAGQAETAQDLTTLLRSARAVTVNKKTIGDPTLINVKKFIKKTKKNYLRSSGKKLDKSNVMLGQLLEAIKQVVTEAQSGKYADKWTKGDYANKFLPARFARQTGLAFEKITDGKGIIKLTTSDDLLVNLANKADEWENKVIETMFLKPNWERNKVFSEKTSTGYRLILPEYYKSGCMACHGGDQGKKIHSKPISGNIGDFGGAISVILK